MIAVERKHKSRFDNGYNQISTDRECINVFWFSFLCISISKVDFHKDKIIEINCSVFKNLSAFTYQISHIECKRYVFLKVLYLDRVLPTQRTVLIVSVLVVLGFCCCFC